jgi:hypothetical protein
MTTVKMPAVIDAVHFCALSGGWLLAKMQVMTSNAIQKSQLAIMSNTTVTLRNEPHASDTTAVSAFFAAMQAQTMSKRFMKKMQHTCPVVSGSICVVFVLFYIVKMRFAAVSLQNTKEIE